MHINEPYHVEGTIPLWWRDNAKRLLNYLLHESGVDSDFTVLVNSAVSRGRFLRGSIALRMRHWLPELLEEPHDGLLLELLGQVEMIHSAACILDDIIDGDSQRRGVPSFQARAGLPSALITSMHMISRALRNEKRLLEGKEGPLAGAFDRMVIGEAYDALEHFGLKQNRGDKLSFVLQKTKPLFACAFSYLGILKNHANSSFVESCEAFGESLGETYQMANDFHDVFSIGPLVRGNAKDAVAITYSMPYECGVQLGLVKMEDIGTKMTRQELQFVYDGWRKSGAAKEAQKRLSESKQKCLNAFPGKPPEELKQVMELIITKAFWDYSYGN